MELIVKVTSPGLQLPLSDLLRLPLGLDIWEVKSDHLIFAPQKPRSIAWPTWATASSSCKT